MNRTVLLWVLALVYSCGAAFGQGGGVLTSWQCSGTGTYLYCPSSDPGSKWNDIGCACLGECTCTSGLATHYRVWWSLSGQYMMGIGSVGGGFAARITLGAWGQLYLICTPNPNQYGSGYDYEDCDGFTSGNTFNIAC